MSAVLWPASPATAGPGDAEVRGVSFAFWSRYGPPVLETSARVSWVRLSMFGVEVVSVAEATGTTRRGRDEPPRATATSSGAELFGEPVDLDDDRPRGGPVTVPGCGPAGTGTTQCFCR
ncbi:hypothetical protein [Plantactinospora sp. B5E13]